MTEPPKRQKSYWLDRRRNVDKVFWGLCAFCAALFLADAFYARHGEFAWQEWFGFYALFGFIVCVFLVLAAKQLRKILMRGEDYYDR